MTTEEKDELGEIGTVRKTCPKCHTRLRVKPNRATCSNCGGSYYKKEKEEKTKSKRVKSSLPSPLKKSESERTETKTERRTQAIIGVGDGKASKRKVEKKLSNISNMEFFIQSKRGAKATALINDEGIVVLKGSATTPDWVTSTPEAVKNIGKKLRDKGVIINDLFTQDHIFKSSSMAAAIVQGRSANGLRDWKDKGGKSLKEVMGKTI